MDKRWMSTRSVADYLDIRPENVMRLVRAGKLPQPSYLSPRRPRWDREEIDEAMGKRMRSRDPDAALADWLAKQETRRAEKQTSGHRSGTRRRNGV